MMNRVGYRRRNASQAYLADSPSAKGVELVVWIVEECYIDCGTISIYSDDVIRKARIDRGAGTLVIFSCLKHGHANSHDHCAFDLVSCSTRIDHTDCVTDRNYTTHAKTRNLWLPGHFSEVCAVTMERILLSGIAKDADRFCRSADSFYVGNPQYICEAHLSPGLALDAHDTVGKLKLVGTLPLERAIGRTRSQCKQPLHRILGGLQDGGSNGGVALGTAANGTRRKCRVANHDVDFVHWNSGFVGHNLSNCRIRSTANVLCSTGDTGCTVPSQFDRGFGISARSHP